MNAPKDYTADDYKRMLVCLLDATYGASPHHIGDGDGLNPKEAAEIKEFWGRYLDDYVHHQVSKGTEPIQRHRN